MNDIIDVQSNEQKAQGLKNIGWVSYVLHLIVAVGAVLPGAQASALLLVIALVIDLVKRSDAEGTWQANHFSWRIRSTFAATAFPTHSWVAFLIPSCSSHSAVFALLRVVTC